MNYQRERRAIYDPARALTYGVLFGVIVLTLFICAVIAWQVYHDKPVGTEFIGALTFIMGWLTSEAGGIYSNRFGSTQQSAAKDATIQQQAHTAAVIAGAVPQDNTAGTIQADDVKIDAKTATVNTAAPKPPTTGVKP